MQIPVVNVMAALSAQIQYEFILINDAVQKLNSIRVRLRMAQEKSRNM
jgi:hypothetical protein